MLGCVTLVSCSKDDDDDNKNNTAKLAVTGAVLDSGETWAEVEGYVNNTDKKTNISTPVKEYGVEYSLAEDGAAIKKIKGSGLANSKFSVKITGLKPGTKYQYRTYVIPDDPNDTETKYGDFKSFKTVEKLEPYLIKDGITFEIKSEANKTAKVTRIDDL